MPISTYPLLQRNRMNQFTKTPNRGGGQEGGDKQWINFSTVGLQMMRHVCFFTCRNSILRARPQLCSR
uniref:Uncharacterized protein n=1 Tax=Anguilla anguilla TaxID=7936 RepID=A0A0E9X4F9_ANGAN